MKPTLKKLFENLKCNFNSLRKWQEKFSDYWEKCDNFELIGIRTPTGSGKTLIGLLILEQGRLSSKRGVYLTHTYQLMDRISKEAAKLNIKHIILGGAFGVTGEDYKKRKEQINDYNEYKHIIISNYDAFLKTKDFPKNIDILIIDDIDLFYDKIRNYFSVKINNIGNTKKIYEQILSNLSSRNYTIIKKIKENTATLYDSNLLFPHDYTIIENIIEKNINILRDDDDFYFPYKNSLNYLDYYCWYLNKNELSIEPYIFPINELKIPNTSLNRFDNIEKIILLSATLGNPERFILELGLSRKKIKLICEEDFEKDGIQIIMGEKLIFPIIESDLEEVNPLGVDFIKKSIPYTETLISSFNKILLLCWENLERDLIIKEIDTFIDKNEIFSFVGKDYNVIDDFSNAKSGYLIIANRYFGLDFPSRSCNICLLTRLPTYLNNFDVIIQNFVKDLYFYYELQTRRIVQSLGRINRSENDIAIYFILDPRFHQAIINNIEFYPLFDKNLKLILKFSIKKSKYGTLEDAILISKDFLEGKENIKKELEQYLISEKIKESEEFEKNKQILVKTFQEEVKGWSFLYKNDFNNAIMSFERIIDILSENRSIPEFLRKIEWYNYIIYLIYFKLEKKATKSYSNKLKTYEEKIISSKELIWLNEITLCSTEKIKIQKTEIIEDLSLTQKKFLEYSKKPELYLEDLINLEEIKSSLKSLIEVLQNLGSGQIASPMRNLAVEFENICKNILKNHLPDIYKEYKDDEKFDISGVLKALVGNNYLRKSIYKILNDEPRSLRNSIIHIKDNIIEYAETIKYCNDLKNGIKILLKEVYFSNMLRKSENLLDELKTIEKFKFLSHIKRKEELLIQWSEEKIEFDPKIDENSEISSYSGTLIINSEGKEFRIKIDLVL